MLARGAVSPSSWACRTGPSRTSSRPFSGVTLTATSSCPCGIAIRVDTTGNRGSPGAPLRGVVGSKTSSRPSSLRSRRGSGKRNCSRCVSACAASVRTATVPSSSPSGSAPLAGRQSPSAGAVAPHTMLESMLTHATATAIEHLPHLSIFLTPPIQIPTKYEHNAS